MKADVGFAASGMRAAGNFGSLEGSELESPPQLMRNVGWPRRVTTYRRLAHCDITWYLRRRLPALNEATR